MTSSLAQHTPLESLLLLHALRSDGLTAISRISEQLKNIPLIRNDPTYDGARLGEDALKHLYLGLLKDEAHRGPDQDRKRRQPSPTLPTVEEAARQSHLIPRLVHRLYTRYRQHVVAEIRDEEARYDALTREIDDVENEQRDEQAAAAAVAPAEDKTSRRPVSEPVATAPSTPQAPEPPAPAVPAEVNGGAPEREPSAAADRPNGTVQRQESTGLDRAKIDAVINHDPVTVRPTPTPPLPPPTSPAPTSEPPPPQQQQQQQQQTTRHAPATTAAPTATALPPLSEMAPEAPAPHAPHASLHHQQSGQHPAHLAPSPQLPAPLQSGPGYRLSPVIQQGGFAPHFARPHGQGSPQPSHSPSPSSPRPVLPLPPGMSMPQLPPHSPVMSNRGGPAQYPSPNQRMAPVPLQPATRPPHVQHTPPSYPQPYPPAYHQPQPPYSPRPPHPGGYQLPPFQVSAQDPNRAHQHHTPQHVPQQVPPHARPQVTPVRQSVPASYPPHTPYTHPGHAQLAGTILNTLEKKHVRSTEQKQTRSTWKGFRPSYLSRPCEWESPAPEPNSPTRTRAPSLPRQPKGVVAKPKPTEEPVDAPKLTEEPIEEPKPTEGPVEESKPTEEPVEEPKPTEEPVDEPTQQIEEPEEPTPKPAPSSRKSTRRNRAPSIASSAVASSIRARTRSRSILSHADNQPAVQEPPVPSNMVKDEPMTPADLLQEELLAHEETPTQARASRTRRGNASSSKRKRQPSTSPPARERSAETPGYETPPNDKVQASRNFQRLSQVIMNDIATHKHAGPFQKPVREKDAEGYGDIIKRPQDLKSIKAAITFGARAINAAAAASAVDSPAATPGASSALVTLDKTADLVPPRAIVNSSQLEKEVLRMFANAVMFNPGDGGDGGMVQDAREMADDIEAKVRDWRGAERQVEGRERDDDDGPAPVGKRRKL